MRVFSKFEKSILEQIINLENEGDFIIVPNLYRNGLLNIKSQINIEGRAPEYKLKENEFHFHKVEIIGKTENVWADILELKTKLYETNDLLDFLLLNGYIIRYERTKPPRLVINRQEFVKSEVTKIENSDDEDDDEVITIPFYIDNLTAQFLDKCNYYYQPKETLRYFVKNGFQTKDERNNRITRYISIFAVIISLVGLILSAVKSEKKEPLKIDNTLKIDSMTIDYIINKLKPEQIDSIKNQLPKH